MQGVCSSPWAQLDNAQYQQRAIAAWSTPAWLLSDVLRILPEHSTWRIMIMGTYCLYQRLFTVPHFLCQAQKKKKKKWNESAAVQHHCMLTWQELRKWQRGFQICKLHSAIFMQILGWKWFWTERRD